MKTIIKNLLQLPIRTNNNRLKIDLGLLYLNTYLICRLLRLISLITILSNSYFYDGKIKENEKEIYKWSIYGKNSNS